MPVTLRTKLMLLLSLLIVSALLGSTFLYLSLSQWALERRTQDDALLLSRLVGLHAPVVLRSAGPEVLTADLQALREEHRHTTAIEVFFFDTSTVASAPIRSPSTIPMVPPTTEEREAMRAGRFLSTVVTWQGERFVNVITPISEDGAVVGAVRVRIFLTGVQRLRTTGAFATVALIFASGLSLFLLLSRFLDLQVNRPLSQLVTAMNAAEAGDLRVRATVAGQDEFGRLAFHFNRMLDRIEQADAENQELVAHVRRLNEELETRVAQATYTLATRNEELLRLQREMGRVEPLAALGRITATIAHELGTPLNSILGYTQLLARADLPEPMHRRLQTIESQVRRMVDTLQYYLARTRGSRSTYQPVDVNALVRETVGLLQPTFQHHRVQLVTALTETQPALRADRGSLQRVLINLLNNAVDAMETGGMVTVTTREETLADTTRAGIAVEVTDTGAGMAPELVAKLFSLFMTTKEPGKGSGLGLAICQEIIQAHGGRIDVHSQLGQGTTVRVFLTSGEQRPPAAVDEGGRDERTHFSD